MPDTRPRPLVRPAGGATTVAGALGAASGLAALGTAAAGRSLGVLLDTPEAVIAPSFGIVACLLTSHERARRIAALMGTVALLAGSYALASALTTAWAGGDPGPLQQLVGWVALWAWVPSLGLVVAVLPHVVPEGAPLPGPWRRLALAAVVVVAGGTVLAALAPRAPTMDPALDNPLGIDALDPVVAPLGLGLVLLGALLSLAGLVSLVVRFRRTSGEERRQVAWFGYAVAGTVIATAVAPSGVRALAVLLVPAGVVVAALRYRLYDIDRLVNRTAVATLLLGGAAAVYAAVAGWAAVLLGEGSPVASFTAAVVVALAFHPARVRVQRIVDRFLAPDRVDPVALTRDVDRALREAPTPRAGLAAAAELLRERLHATAVEVIAGRDGADETTVARSGEGRPTCDVRLDLAQHGVRVGRLLLTGGDADGHDLVRRPALQAAVAGPLATAVHAWWLSHELEESRLAIVSAREEERRRLRRDLHDGLGPQLAAISMTLETARHALARRPERVDALLATGVEQSRSAVGDIRTVVAGLRPPALDELGLEGALRSTGPAVLADHDASTRIVVTAAPGLGPAGAATEVAAYRIAQEALTNAVRHGRASLVEVALSRDGAGALRVVVTDDGTGFDPDGADRGVGLGSMTERAVELGGSLTVTSAPGHGTVVTAPLPDRKDPTP